MRRKLKRRRVAGSLSVNLSGALLSTHVNTKGLSSSSVWYFNLSCRFRQYRERYVTVLQTEVPIRCVWCSYSGSAGSYYSNRTYRAVLL